MRQRHGDLEVTALDRTRSPLVRPAAKKPASGAAERLKPNGLDVLTIQDVAVYLRLPVSTAYRLAQRKELPGYKVGRHWRFHRRTLEDWFRERVAQPDRAPCNPPLSPQHVS